VEETVNELRFERCDGERITTFAKMRWKKGREGDAGRCRGVVYLVYPVRLQPSRPASEYAQPPRLSLHFWDLRHDHFDATRETRYNLVIGRD
jgi:hypothetical protein